MTLQKMCGFFVFGRIFYCFTEPIIITDNAFKIHMTFTKKKKI